MLWNLLAGFVFRLCFGLAIAMAWIPSRTVTSGFYRIHLWVLMGLNTFAALAVGTQSDGRAWPLGLAISAAAFSYVGAVIWMYESRTAGILALGLVAGLDFAAALWIAAPTGSTTTVLATVASVATGGLLLGLTLSSMLLGHWYLNTPTMQLYPLRRLILTLMVVVALRALLCGSGLVTELSAHGVSSIGWGALLTLRWLSGLVGIAVLLAMTWQTLKIPNTQSATGILYVAVIFSFLGELSSQMLATEARLPL